jgi:Mn2+/Fe2+ NRAMP family transporter
MSQVPPPRGFVSTLRMVGPGLVVAATGVGAGDLVAAAKAGALYGLPLLWTAVLGALLKFVLAEGVARWQLATGETILEGWAKMLGRPVRIIFLIYLLLWTFIVSAALMSACGLAAHALFPQLSVNVWAMLHALAGLAFVWRGGYGFFESAMKWAIGLMFLAIVGSAILQAPPAAETLRGFLLPILPEGSTIFVLGVIGGIGGTLTLLSYNYWLKEKGWSGHAWMRAARVDLGVGYILTGIFGIAVILLGGLVLLPRGISISGSKGVLEMAVILAERFGRPGELVFLIGFWGAVATSLLGVWQGVPYLFGNYMGLMRGVSREEMPSYTHSRSPLYRAYVLFMTFPPMLLLLLGKPVWLVIAYAALGALFMPFLASTLLVMNNRSSLGELKNGILANAGLVLSLLLFAWLALNRLSAEFAKLLG